MGRRKKETNKNNLKVAAIFAVFVGFLLLVSLALKAFLLIKQSTFDGVNQFTVVFSGDVRDKKTVVSFFSEGQSISVLNISGEIAVSRVGRFLESPIDGKMSHPIFGGYLGQKDVEKILRSMILGYKDLKTDLTIIDVIRLWYVSRTLLPSSVSVQEISTTLEEGRIDKISYSLLSDSAIVKEKLSIQIINGTGVTGLGNRLARLVTNMGGNVIAVSTSDNDITHSEIVYMDEKSYTAERLQKALGFPAKDSQKPGLSDITITIGSDSLKSLVF